MQFEAPPATRPAAWMPAIFVGVLLPLLVLLPIVRTGPSWSIVLHVCTIVGLTALLLWVWARLRVPLRYAIDGGVLLVPASFGSVRVPLAGARLRVGGPTGWKVSGTAIPPFLLGAFMDQEGPYHAAASADRGVWVQGTRRVFVTPANIPAFVEALVLAGASAGEVPGNDDPQSE